MLKIAIALVVAAFALSQTAFVVPEWEQALVLQFGKPVRTIKSPGLYFKIPFAEEVFLMEKRVLLADAKPAEYITLDKKRLIVDSVSRWKIKDPLLFYQSVKNYTGAIARLNDITFRRLRQEIANHDFKAFIREKREDIMAAVTEATGSAAISYGIEVVDVRIKRVDLPEEVQSSVFARMKAERERIAKRYRAEGNEQARQISATADKEKEIVLAEAYRQAETLRGEGDADATSIYADAYGKDAEFYSFFRHLGVYERIFNSETTLLLRPDSELLKYLDSPSGAKRKAGEPVPVMPRQ